MLERLSLRLAQSTHVVVVKRRHGAPKLRLGAKLLRILRHSE